MAMCCSFLWSSALPAFAQGDGFDPSNPPEPGPIDFCKIVVSADPAEGAYVSGAGKYKLTNGSVYISTSAKNTDDYTYTFQYWTLNGVKYTTSRNFYYTPQKGTMNFIAHYEKNEVVFDPASPSDPSNGSITRKYMLYLQPSIEGACTFNVESGVKRQEGTSIYLRVYPSEYYKFEGWKVNGKIISTSTSFYYTMPSAATTIEAVLSEIPFDPENPIDPPSAGGDIDTGDTMMGDVNGDGKVTISDIVATLSLMNGGTTEGLNEAAADVNNDNKITISDVVGILSIMNGKD